MRITLKNRTNCHDSLGRVFEHQGVEGNEDTSNSPCSLISPYWSPNFTRTSTSENSGAGVARTATVTKTLDYYPYGETRVDSGTNTEKTQYIGETYDQSTGLNYLNARYLNAKQGRFMSQDPVFFEVGQSDDGKKVLRDPQAMNSYSYAQNNPITRKDPDGRCGLPCAVVYGLFSPSVAYSPAVGEENDTNQRLESTIFVAGFASAGGKVGEAGRVIEDGVMRGGVGYQSFSSAKRVLGKAGDNMQWHHLVEQGINKGKFLAEELHNTKNLVAIQKELHQKISGFYSSKQDYLKNQTVRQWIGNQSLQKQLDYGRKQLLRIQKQLNKK